MSCLPSSLLFVDFFVVVAMGNISAYNESHNSTDYITDNNNASWEEAANLLRQSNDPTKHDLTLEYHSIATNASDDEYKRMELVPLGAPRAAFIGALVAVAAVVIFMVTSKVVQALHRTICKRHNQRTTQHEGNTSQQETNFDETNGTIWSISRANDRHLTKMLDDGKHVPFKFDRVNYLSGGGMESGFIPDVARYYRDVVGGSEAYDASTLSSSVFSDETTNVEFSDDDSATFSTDTSEIDLFGFQEVIVDQ